MDSEADYRVWAEDAQTLAEIGRHLFLQPTRISVRLPRALAERAVAAWQRNEDTGALAPETAKERETRHRAGTLSLIGVSIEERAVAQGDEVVVEVDAWYIGEALEAANDAGLLDGIGARMRTD